MFHEICILENGASFPWNMHLINWCIPLPLMDIHDALSFSIFWIFHQNFSQVKWGTITYKRNNMHKQKLQASPMHIAVSEFQIIVITCSVWWQSCCIMNIIINIIIFIIISSIIIVPCIMTKLLHPEIKASSIKRPHSRALGFIATVFFSSIHISPNTDILYFLVNICACICTCNFCFPTYKDQHKAAQSKGSQIICHCICLHFRICNYHFCDRVISWALSNHFDYNQPCLVRFTEYYVFFSP